MPMPEYDTRRIWRGISLLAPSTNLNPKEPSRIYSLFVKPDKKLTTKDFLALFNDYYQGTPYNEYGQRNAEFKTPVARNNVTTYKQRGCDPAFQINDQRQYQLAPEWGTERLIGTAKASTTWCAQLRSWMPNPIGGLLWAGLSQGSTTGHIPLYSGMTSMPKPYIIGTNTRVNGGHSGTYDDQSAYWVFREVSNLVNLFYTATKDKVIPVWRAWEDKLYQSQPFIEQAA